MVKLQATDPSDKGTVGVKSIWNTYVPECTAEKWLQLIHGTFRCSNFWHPISHGPPLRPLRVVTDGMAHFNFIPANPLKEIFIEIETPFKLL